MKLWKLYEYLTCIEYAYFYLFIENKHIFIYWKQAICVCIKRAQLF